MLLLTELLSIQAADLDCPACEPLLAGFLEIELDEGEAAALRAYPQVGRHLWTCPACGELAELTRPVLVAARAGALGPPRRSDVLAPLRLGAALLRAALDRPAPLLGAARGPDEGPDVLFESQQGGYMIMLLGARDDDHTWTLTVAVEPPAEGRFVLSSAGHHYEASLREGAAVLGALPAGLFEADDGQDLIGHVVIEP